MEIQLKFIGEQLRSLEELRQISSTEHTDRSKAVSVALVITPVDKTSSPLRWILCR
jgi:hypothetical protein